MRRSEAADVFGGDWGSVVSLMTADDGLFLDSDLPDLAGVSVRQLRVRNDRAFRRRMALVQERIARVQITVGGGTNTAERVD